MKNSLIKKIDHLLKIMFELFALNLNEIDRLFEEDIDMQIKISKSECAAPRGWSISDYGKKVLSIPEMSFENIESIMFGDRDVL